MITEIGIVITGSAIVITPAGWRGILPREDGRSIAALDVDGPRSQKGGDGGRATVHAADPGNPAPEVGPGAAATGRWPEASGSGWAPSAPRVLAGPGRRAGLGPGPGADRRRPGGPLYGRPDVAGQRHAPSPDCAWISRRAPQARRHAGAAPPRVPGAAPRRLPLHAVLRPLPPLAASGAGLSMRQVHRAGEKCFVDYAGQKPRLIDAATGEVDRGRAVRRRARRLELHLRRGDPHPAGPGLDRQPSAGLRLLRRRHRPRSCPTSSRAASPSRAATSRASSAPTRSSRSTTAPSSCRRGPASPATRRRSRSACRSPSAGSSRGCATRRFFSLAALNARIAELLADLNARPDAPVRRQPPRALRAPRPARAAAAAGRALRLRRVEDDARVNIDYHVELDGHYYSVPYALVRRAVDARLTATTVELFQRGQRVAAHRARATSAAATPPTPSTCPRPISAISSGRPRASSPGPAPSARRPPPSSTAILADRPHPEQGYRSCLGILRLAKRYGAARLEAACARALAVGARSYRHVDSILKHGLDRLPLPEPRRAAHPRSRPRAPPRPGLLPVKEARC